MPTYEYECKKCGIHFEQKQSMNDAPLQECPDCQGEVSRLISGGTGFILKGGGSGGGKGAHEGGGCSLEQTGRTCCGRDQRCGKSPCGD